MCAIHGFLHKDTNKVAKMIKAAHHRGPDGNGAWSDSNITLGHNLLSIVDDADASAQPWHHEDCVLVFNGEIYNYKELQSTIKHKCVTNTDTEVLAAGLKEQGWEFLKKCDGMFAVAFYNKTTRQLILARDTNGAKPLYYGYKDKVLHFSSEIKSLLAVGFERRVCKQALAQYYNQGYNPGYLTMFEGIKKLVPGEVWINDSRTNLLDYTLDPVTETDPKVLGAEVKQLNQHSVNQTLMGRRNIGLFLSGGLDSGSILAEMRELGVKPVTFTSSFATTDPESRLNEDSELAERLCRDWDIENYHIHQTQQDYVDALDATFYALEEPRQGKSFPTYYNTNKFISNNNIVVTLSGDGGDEIFAGYKHHSGIPNWRNKLKMWRTHNRPLDNPELQCTLEDQMDYLNEWLPKTQMTGDALNDFMYTECLNSVAEDFLVRNDKLGMSFSMEARFPILNKSLRDYVRAIPGATKVDSMFADAPTEKHKLLQKEAYRGILPDYIINHKKTGWRFPTDEILVGRLDSPAPDNGVLKDYIRDILSSADLMDIFEYKKSDIENKYLNNKEFTSKNKGPGIRSQKELFVILNFAVWKKVYGITL
jgi:asparagine synthase (glutamine-hydrolysing)